MANDLLVPVLGLGRGEGTLVGWYREDGEEVHAGDLVFCFEAGNVAIDVEAPEDGLVWHEAAAGAEPRWGEIVGVILGPGEAFVPRGRVHDEAPAEPTPAAVHYAFESYEAQPAVEQEETPDEPVVPVNLPLLRRSHSDEPQGNAFWGAAPGDQTEFDSPLLWRSASEAWPWGRDENGQARRRRMLPLGPVGHDDEDADPPADPLALHTPSGWEDDPGSAADDGDWEPIAPGEPLATPAPSIFGHEGWDDAPSAPETPAAPEPDRWAEAPPVSTTWNIESNQPVDTWASATAEAAPTAIFEDDGWAVSAEPAEWDTPAPAAWPPAPTTPIAWETAAPAALAAWDPPAPEAAAVPQAWDEPEPGSLAATGPVWGGAEVAEDGDWVPLSETLEPWPGEPAPVVSEYLPPPDGAVEIPEPECEPVHAAFEARGDVVEPWDDPAGAPDPEESALVRIDIAAPATAPALWMRSEIAASGLLEIQQRLANDWGAPGPSVAILVAAAAARALEENGAPPADVLLETPWRGESQRALLRAAGQRPFRELVEDAASGCPPEAAFDCTVTDLGAAGVDEGIAPIVPGLALSVAVGSLRDLLSFAAGRPALTPVVTVSLAYDPALVTPGDAAWLLGRVRALCETPHALLAA